MGKSSESGEGKSEKLPEKGWRFYRNFNAVGAVALLGAAVILPPLASGLAMAGGALNAAQAGFGEFMLKRSQKKKLRKSKD